MATVVKTFSFNGGTSIPYTAEGGSWQNTDGVATAGSIVSAANYTSDPGGGNGLQESCTGKNKTNAGNFWAWSGTWEDLGVTAGSTVTAVEVTYFWRCSTFTTGSTTGCFIGPFTLTDSGGTTQATGPAKSQFTTTTAYAQRDTGVLSVPSAVQPSNTLIQLRLGNDLATGSSNTAVVTLQQDFVQVTVTYTAPQPSAGASLDAVVTTAAAGGATGQAAQAVTVTASAAGSVPVTVANNFEGGTDGTAITTANSGGASGTAWDSLGGSATLPVYSSAGAITGTLGASTPLSGNSTTTIEWKAAFASGFNASSIPWYARDYFRVTSYPPAVARLSKWQTDVVPQDVWAVTLDTTGHLGIRNLVAGTAVATAATAVALNTPARYEFSCTYDGATYSVTLRCFYGTNVGGVTPDETISGSISYATLVNVGAFGAQTSTAQTWSTVYHDSIVLTTAGWPGPVAPAGTATQAVTVTTSAAGTVATGGTSYRSTILADSPSVYYRLGGTAAPAIPDAGAGGVNAAMTGTVTFGQAGALAGDADTACSFPGTSGYLQTAASPGAAYNLGDGPFSIECWFKQATTGVLRNLITKGTSGYIIRISATNKLILRKSGATDILVTTATFTDTTGWHHVVATRNGTGSANTHIYVDGVDQAGVYTEPATGIADTTTGFTIGADAAAITTGPWNGLLDEVALYKSVLSQAQVTAHYSAGTGAGGAFTGAATEAVIVAASAAGSAAGSASQAVTVGTSAAGTVAVTGAATLPVTAATSAAGGGTGSGSTPVTVTTTAAGTVSAAGTGSATLAVTVIPAAAGTVAVSGAATQAVTAATSAAGNVAASGAASRPVTVGTSAAGSAAAAGQGTAALTVTAGTTAAGTVAVTGSGIAPAAVATSAAGSVATASIATRPVTVATTAAGSAAAPAYTGTASQAVSVAVSASGTVAATGSALRPVTVGTLAAGNLAASQAALAALTVTVAASGESAVPPAYGTTTARYVTPATAQQRPATASSAQQRPVPIAYAQGGTR